MITIFPTFIQPLFNKFSPLEDGPLKDQIEALAKSVEFPLTKLYVIDGSKRSSHSNAYFFGLFKNKRIVLFDTLLDDSTQEEILAILGHELGHWKLNHVTSRLVVTQLHLITVFLVFQQFITNKSLYEAFGFVDGAMPVLIGFVLFQYLYAPIEAVVGFLLNVLSRKHEFEADAFAVQLGKAHPLATGLLKLQKKNLGDMNPDPLYSAYHFSHPPLTERLSAIPVTLTKEDVLATKISEKKED
ncbi:zinc metalloprotease [Entomophthora muscae]|nr:zinc metalloprotease [Entomophthora muscae]